MPKTQISLAAFAEEMVDVLPLLMRSIWMIERNYVSLGKITMPQFGGLHYLLEHGGVCTMRDLAGALHTCGSSATAIVDRLVALRLARRERDPHDRRVVRVAIAPKGIRVMDQIRRQRRGGLIRMFGTVSVAERSRYLDIIRKLVRGLESPAAKGRS